MPMIIDVEGSNPQQSPFVGSCPTYEGFFYALVGATFDDSSIASASVLLTTTALTRRAFAIAAFAPRLPAPGCVVGQRSQSVNGARPGPRSGLRQPRYDRLASLPNGCPAASRWSPDPTPRRPPKSPFPRLTVHCRSDTMPEARPDRPGFCLAYHCETIHKVDFLPLKRTAKPHGGCPCLASCCRCFCWCWRPLGCR